MTTILKELAILSPFVVCLFSFILLFIKYGKEDKAKRIMSIYFLCATIFYAINILKDFDKPGIYNWFHTFNTALFLMACPQVYFYIRALTTGKVRDKYFIYHFLPALLMLVFGSILYFQIIENVRIMFIDGLLDKNVDNRFDVSLLFSFFFVFKLIFIIQVVLYYAMSYILLYKHQKELNNIFSDISGYELDWVKYFLIVVLLWGIVGEFGYDHLTVKLVDNIAIKYIANLIICVLVPCLYLLSSMQKSLSIKIDGPEIKMPVNINNHKLKNKLISCFESSEIYLKKDLTIWDVCRETNSNRTYISNLINEEFGMNFNSLVNKYRIQKAKQLLQDKTHQNQSLDKIAELSGFNSLASFNRAFQKFENESPGNYRKISLVDL